jgi:hypothetical protein
MARLRYNGLTAALGASLTNSATSVTFAAGLTHSGGTNVPTITGSDYIPLTILDASGNVSEIVNLTAYTAGATTGTISRAQEGTTGVAHSSDDKIVHAPTVLDINPGAWTSYTPAWTSSGTAPALGNGTLTGAYSQWGKVVNFRFDLTLGSTSTMGTGSYRFSLPVAAKSLSTSHGILLSGYLENAGVAPYGAVGARMTSGSTTTIEILHWSNVGNGQVNVVGQTLPFTWGDADFIRVYGTYEAA